MKKKFVGILLATTLIVSSDLGMNVENVYADNVNNSGNSTAATVLQSENKDINQSQSVTGGYIKSDLDYNTPVYDPGISMYSMLPDAYPGSVSAVTSNYPDYRNQNPYGTCWAFASTGLAEFDLINDGSADRNIDLSELALAYYTFNSVTDPLGGTTGDYTKYYNENATTSYLNYGGNFEMAARRYAQWVGPTNESLVPYSQAASVLKNGLDDSYAYNYDQAHLENAYMISIKQSPDDVKKMIMEHGAVGVMYQHDDYSLGWNDNIARYTYHDDDKSGGGHAVMVVGWDDNFSKDNFTAASKPVNDGVWLVRNSWGIYASYFWMSYETCSLADTAWVFDFDADDGYDNNYQVDGGIMGYPDQSHKVMMNIFDAQEKPDDEYEELKAVSLTFSRNAGVNYTIDVYTDISDGTGNKFGNSSVILNGTKQEASTTTGTTTYAGIHTIPLKKSVKLTPGSKFAIVITLDTAALDYEQAMGIAGGSDLSIPIWDCGVSRGNNKSFYYSGGRYYPHYWGNYCIKAFTSNETVKEELQNQLTPKGYSLYLKEHIGAQLYASLSSDILEDTGAKVRFTYPDSSYVDKPLSDFDTDTYDNENVKVLTYEAVPAKLTEKVDISIIKSDGTQSNSYVFSPADYLDEFLSGQDENGVIVKQKAIAKALLNYGAYAQLYFDENTSDLANKNLTDNAVETLSVDDILKNTVDEDTSKLDNGDLEYIGTSLVCTDETAMKVYFVNKNQLTLDQIKQKYDIKVNGDSPYASNCNYETTLDGSLMCIKIKELYPYMLSSNYTILITNKDSSDKAEGVVSPYSYIRKAVQGKDEKLASLCKAMYLYGEAVEYFATPVTE